MIKVTQTRLTCCRCNGYIEPGQLILISSLELQMVCCIKCLYHQHINNLRKCPYGFWNDYYAELWRLLGAG